MATETPSVAPPRAEVPMVDAEVVRQIRELHRGGWGAKRIARELEVARNTVRRYLRLRTVEAGIQIRPRARQLDAPARAEALRLFDGPAEHNAVVVTQLLRERGVAATERVVQKVVAPRRRELRALQLATVRYETAPGHQMQVDFGQKRVRIGERTVVVHLLVAVLSYSRRIFVKAFLAERGDDWREGIAEAFRHFGGVPRTVLGDNARALVVRHDRGAQTVVFHPAYLAFCRDWDGVPRACGPYRARTKGKTESGVKYVKRNALAGRSFPSFAALGAHLVPWMREADQRVHGTTFEVPRVRFEREEGARLRPLPARTLVVRERRLRRRGARAQPARLRGRRRGGRRMSAELVHPRVVDPLKRLRLGTLADRLDATLGEAARVQPTYIDFLDQLLRDEMAAKQRRRIEMGIQIAHFPSVKTLEDFDFKFQPSIDAKLVRELATGRFIASAENALFFGPPGVGKTHLAIALGRAVVEAGHTVLFTTATALLADLVDGQSMGILASRMFFYGKPKLLVVDELGYMPLERQSAHLFFQLVSHRYEKASMLITTNQSVTQWGQVFGDDVIAAAILDRLLHHSHTFMVQGESYRLRQKRKAGLRLHSAPPLES